MTEEMTEIMTEEMTEARNPRRRILGSLPRYVYGSSPAAIRDGAFSAACPATSMAPPQLETRITIDFFVWRGERETTMMTIDFFWDDDADDWPFFRLGRGEWDDDDDKHCIITTRVRSQSKYMILWHLARTYINKAAWKIGRGRHGHHGEEQ